MFFFFSFSWQLYSWSGPCYLHHLVVSTQLFGDPSGRPSGGGSTLAYTGIPVDPSVFLKPLK
jgi:hypothetical protein